MTCNHSSTLLLDLKTYKKTWRDEVVSANFSDKVGFYRVPTRLPHRLDSILFCQMNVSCHLELCVAIIFFYQEYQFLLKSHKYTKYDIHLFDYI
jgi:hypothetical protein